MNHQAPPIALSLLLIPALVPAAHAQLILDGDFEGQPAGTSPDCVAPAGAWGWFTGECLPCEAIPANFTIVDVASFKPGGVGNALQMQVIADDVFMALPNIFTRELHQDTDPFLVVVFDVWIDSPGVRNNIVIGGPNDPKFCGIAPDSDRAVQIGWQGDGTMTVPIVDETGCPTVLHPSYPYGAWQTLRVEIELDTDTVDIWWAENGDPLTLLADDAMSPSTFWTGAEVALIDRFHVVTFAGEVEGCIPFAGSHMYLDNLAGSTCRADVDVDGAVGIADLLQVLAAWGPCAVPCVEDLNESGAVGINDLLEVLASWGDCS